MGIEELNGGERVAIVGDFEGIEEGDVGEEERGKERGERRVFVGVRREREEREEGGGVLGDGERGGGRGGAGVEEGDEGFVGG